MTPEQRHSDLLAKLQGVRKRGTYHMARCPAHPDKVGSLSIKLSTTGKTLMKCHAGCGFDEIVSAMGVDHAELGPATLKDEVGAQDVYVYVDESWAPVLKKVRIATTAEDGSPAKTFFSYGYDKRTDGWAKDSQCVRAAKIGLLYRSPDIPVAIKKGMPVFCVEGEKAANRLFREGQCATCQPDGAGPGKFTADHAKKLKGADVWIWADRDEVGESYASEIASIVRPLAKSVKIIQSATEGLHDDAWDHFEAGFGLGEVVVRDDLLPQLGRDFTLLSDHESEAPRYLIPPYLPLDKITLLDANGGAGKTGSLLAMMAALSKGRIPWSQERIPPVTSIYYGNEDTPGELRTIFEINGGDPKRLVLPDCNFVLNAKGVQDVHDDIVKHGAGLVIFDAFAYFIAGLVKDMGDPLAVASTMRPLAAALVGTDCACIAVRHTVKAAKDLDAASLGMGSVQFRNTARSQLVLRPHPDQFEHRGEMVYTHEKGSLLTPKGPPFSYVRDGNVFSWKGNLSEDPFETDRKGPKIQDAKQFIEETLRGNEMSSRDFLEIAKTAGMSGRTLERARREMGVISVKRGASWVLTLPEPGYAE